VVGAGTRIALFQRSDSLVHKATHRLSTRVRRFALSPDGQRLAVSDGTDVTTWAFPDASMQARLQFLPEGRFLVRNHTASHFSDNMLPYIRFRQGLELLERGTPAVEAATQRWRSSELPL